MKILMFFHGGSLNRGCEAIVRSGVALIKEEDPSVIIDLASWDPRSDTGIPMIDSIKLDQIRTIEKFSVDWFISAIKVKLFKDESYSFRRIHRDIIDKIP